MIDEPTPEHLAVIAQTVNIVWEKLHAPPEDDQPDIRAVRESFENLDKREDLGVDWPDVMEAQAEQEVFNEAVGWGGMG